MPQGSAMRMTAFVTAIVYHRRKDKLLWQGLSVNVKTYLRKGEFSFSLLGKKKIQKVQIQIDPFISETGKDSNGKPNVIFSLEMGTCTICWLVAIN